MNLIIDIIGSVLFNAAPLALATFAIVLIFRTSYTTNFAQGMIGTFATYVTSFIIAPKFLQGVVAKPNFLQYTFAITMGIIVGFVIGLLIDFLIIRNAKHPNPVSKQIITMGIILILTGGLDIIFGILDKSLPRIGLNFKDTFFDKILLAIQRFLKSIHISVGTHQILGFIISVTILVVIFILLRKTKWGLGVRATASNETVASMLGVNTKRITMVSWGLAGALGSLAAILISSNKGYYGNVVSYFMIPVQVEAFFSAILGGFSTFIGPMGGVLIFTLLKDVFNIYFNPWGITILYFVIMIIVLVKPNGLFGKKVIKKV